MKIENVADYQLGNTVINIKIIVCWINIDTIFIDFIEIEINTLTQY